VAAVDPGQPVYDVKTMAQILEEDLRQSVILVGIGAALGASQLLRSILYGVTPTDARTYASVVAILAAVALVACIAPARRAATVDPLLALRSE
jgi:putative ABC transport system permease protein